MRSPYRDVARVRLCPPLSEKQAFSIKCAGRSEADVLNLFVAGEKDGSFKPKISSIFGAIRQVKMEISKIFFIPFHTVTYVNSSLQKQQIFRQIRADSSYYGGRGLLVNW